MAKSNTNAQFLSILGYAIFHYVKLACNITPSIIFNIYALANFIIFFVIAIGFISIAAYTALRARSAGLWRHISRNKMQRMSVLGEGEDKGGLITQITTHLLFCEACVSIQLALHVSDQSVHRINKTYTVSCRSGSEYIVTYLHLMVCSSLSLSVLYSHINKYSSCLLWSWIYVMASSGVCCAWDQGFLTRTSSRWFSPSLSLMIVCSIPHAT